MHVVMSDGKSQHVLRRVLVGGLEYAIRFFSYECSYIVSYTNEIGER